jgi:hypothetical protein
MTSGKIGTKKFGVQLYLRWTMFGTRLYLYIFEDHRSLLLRKEKGSFLHLLKQPSKKLLKCRVIGPTYGKI